VGDSVGSFAAKDGREARRHRFAARRANCRYSAIVGGETFP